MALGFAALNTGHNLFYLIFAMQVSLIVVSGVLSERTLRVLKVERLVPREVFARAPSAVEVRIANSAKRRTVFAVEVRDVVEGAELRRIGFVDRLEPGVSRSLHAVWTFPQRGRRSFRELRLVTRFPFGFFEKTRIVPLEQEFVVFPPVDRSTPTAFAPDPVRAALQRDRLGEDLFGLRRKLPEDSWRQVHWRVSARAGELVVRESGSGRDAAVSIFFDSRGPAGEAFERAVERAAALVWRLAREGRRFRFRTWDVELGDLEGRAGSRALEVLGEVVPGPPKSSLAFERWKAETLRSGGGLFVTAGEPPPLPPASVLRVA
jgi:uncharacterized protein (DUF58 family)